MQRHALMCCAQAVAVVCCTEVLLSRLFVFSRPANSLVVVHIVAKLNFELRKFYSFCCYIRLCSAEVADCVFVGDALSFTSGAWQLGVLFGS